MNQRKQKTPFRRIEVEDRSSGPHVLILIGVVLIFAFVAWQFIEKLSGSDDDIDDQQVSDQLSDELDRQRSSRIDPDAFDTELGNFETALFSTLPANSTTTLDGDIVARESQALSTVLRQRGRSIDLELAAIVDDIGTTAGDPSFGLADVNTARNEWLRQRRVFLQPAAWLVDASSVDNTVDGTALGLYEQVVLSLAQYADDLTSLAFDLQDTDPGDARAEWAEFTEVWRQDIDNLRQDLPERSLRRPHYADLHLQIEHTITAVAALATADLLGGNVEQRATPALDAIDRVEDSIDSLRLESEL